MAVDTEVEELDDGLLDELLGALRLDRGDLDPVMRPALVHGGNLHPLVLVRAGVLERLDHDGDAVLTLQDAQGWDGTVPVVHRLSATRFASRNPFPRGGIREDPATGSAAAGLGAYLRARGHIDVPAVLTVDQGAEAGAAVAHRRRGAARGPRAGHGDRGGDVGRSREVPIPSRCGGPSALE